MLLTLEILIVCPSKSTVEVFYTALAVAKKMSWLSACHCIQYWCYYLNSAVMSSAELLQRGWME